jgi:hypothetical protein
MLLILPVGENLRLISISKDKLKDCFGIVYAKIQSPKKEDLIIPRLPLILQNLRVKLKYLLIVQGQTGIHQKNY